MNENDRKLLEQYGKTLERIDERSIGLSNRLYDKEGDIPAIKEHLKKLNDNVAKNTIKVAEHEVRLKGFPHNILSKKWFWIIVVLIVLSWLGVSAEEIKALLPLIG